MTFINEHAPHKRGTKYEKQKLTELKGEIENSTVIETLAPTFTNRMTAFRASRLDNLDEREIPGRHKLVELPQEETESLSRSVVSNKTVLV